MGNFKKSILKITGIGALIAAGIYISKTFSSEEMPAIENSLDHRRLNSYYDIMIKWMDNLQDGSSIGDYLKEQGISRVGIYGHGKIGVLLCKELVKADITVEYFVDKTVSNDYNSINDVPVTSVEKIKNYSEVDTIIITPVHLMDEIVDDIRREGYKGEVMSLSVLLYQM